MVFLTLPLYGEQNMWGGIKKRRDMFPDGCAMMNRGLEISPRICEKGQNPRRGVEVQRRKGINHCVSYKG